MSDGTADARPAEKDGFIGVFCVSAVPIPLLLVTMWRPCAVRFLAKHPERPVLDLTPMIDIVFLLIIFFMVAMELKKVDLDQRVRLAEAENVRVGYDTTASPLVINVLPGSAAGEARILAGGREVSWRQLGDLLEVEARLAGLTREGLSPVRVLIRPDRDAPFIGTQRVMAECARHNIVAVAIAAERIDRP